MSQTLFTNKNLVQYIAHFVNDLATYGSWLRINKLFNRCMKDDRIISNHLAAMAKTSSSPHRTFDLLLKIQQIAPIAGGSVVYALCKDWMSKKIGLKDIDIFCNTPTQIIEIANLIGEPEVRLVRSNGGNGDTFMCNVFTGKMHFQIIYDTRYKNAFDLITMFDLDYVECAIHQNKLIQTQECKRAHETRKISTFRFLNRKERLDRAVQKGFRAPLLMKSPPQGGPHFNWARRHVDGNPILLEDLHSCKFIPILGDMYHHKSDVSPTPIKFDDVKIVGFEKTRPNAGNWYGYFVVQYGEQTIKKKYVTIDIVATEQFLLTEPRQAGRWIPTKIMPNSPFNKIYEAPNYLLRKPKGEKKVLRKGKRYRVLVDGCLTSDGGFVASIVGICDPLLVYNLKFADSDTWKFT